MKGGGRPLPTFRTTLLRLVLLPGILLLVGMAAGAWIVVHQTGVLGQKLTSRVAAGLAAQVRDQLDARRDALDQWAAVLEATSSGDRPQVFRRMASFRSWFESVYLLDPGLMVKEDWPSDRRQVGNDFSGQDILRRLGSEPVVLWSGSFLSPRTGRTTVSVARTFAGGVLLANLDLEPLARLVSRLSEGTETSVSLVDAHGTYLAHPDPEVVRLRQPDLVFLSSRESQGAALRGYRETRGGEEFTVSVQGLPETGWTVLVSQPRSALFQPLVPILYLLVPLALFLALGAFFLVWVLDRHLLGALGTLRAQTEGLSRGDFGGGEVKTRYQDLNAILDAFDTMRQNIWLREQDLRLGERRYRRMFEDAAIGIFHTTYSGTLLDMNQSLANLLGYTDIPEAQGALGGSCLGFYVRPEEREAILRMLQDSPEAKIRVTTEFFHRSGGILTVNHHLARVFDPKAGEFLLEAFVEDVTELTRAEEAVRILNRDLEAKVKERTEHLEKALSDLEITQAHLVQSEKNAILLTLHTGVAHDLNTPLGAIRASNETIAVLLRKVLVELPSLLAEMDPGQIQLLRQLNEAADRNLDVVPSATLRRRRRETSAALDRLGVTVDQEMVDSLVELGLPPGLEPWIPLLGTSLGPRAVGMAYALVGLEKACLIISTALDKASAAINELRIASLETREATFERLDLRQNLETVLTLFQHKLRDGVSMKTSLDPQARVWGQADKLNQVWTNLVANAIQAMDDRGSLEILLKADLGRVRVTVADSGPGIPAEIRDRIFEPYFTTRADRGGTGLGLDICRRVVAEHHGTLTVESRPGRTEFTVELPEAR